MKFVMGVDEAGRGPLAGPVMIGIVAVPESFNVAREFPGVADSKQLSPKERERIFAQMNDLVGPSFRFCVRYTSASVIDKRGITRAVAGAVARGVRSLAPETEGVRVYLDGLLKAPPEYAQQTIIGGDENVPIISLASIAAKVSRDRLMQRFAREYPKYGFGEHKGYGTELHYRMLAKYGPCVIHRRSYLPLDEGAIKR